MDTALRQLMDVAARRGSRYVKGEVTISGLQAKMAELGVLLLEKARRFPDLENAGKREELIELQNKLDDLRKWIFASKIKMR
jgi:hypothetical protein